MRGSRTTLPEVPGFMPVLRFGELVYGVAKAPLQKRQMACSVVGGGINLPSNPLRQFFEVVARKTYTQQADDGGGGWNPEAIHHRVSELSDLCRGGR